MLLELHEIFEVNVSLEYLREKASQVKANLIIQEIDN
jgi:hypothetical protein